MKHIAQRVRDSLRKIRIQAHRTIISLSPRSSLTVFMYHNVTSDANRSWGPWQYAITPTAFNQHISVIADEYNVVAMDDVSSHISDSKYTLPDDAAVITFDDGYRNTLKQAVPILEYYDVPAIVYVTTGLLGDEYGPFEFRLAEALRAQSEQSICISDIDLELPNSVPNSPKRAYRTIQQSAKWASVRARAEILDIVEDEVTSGVPMLSMKQLKSLSNNKLIGIGAHSHSHIPLTTLQQDELRKQVKRCTTILRSITGSPIKHFSYPYGAYDANVKRAIENSGIRTSMTTSPHVMFSDDIEKQQLSIPRIDGGRYAVHPAMRHSIY